VNYDNSLVVTITVTFAHGHHLAVTIYLHVAPNTDRHITSLSINLKFYHLSSIL